MNTKLIVVIGAYGSGKSEYSINLAKHFSDKGDMVSLVDLDVVNPYFRSREMREEFKKDGIEVIAPEGSYSHADLPKLSPRIMGEVQNYSRAVILDVGGDPAGCRTLARYIKNIEKRGYEMHYVINTRRPFTSDKKGILSMFEMLEDTSKLTITDVICNTNLMEFTDKDVVEKGIDIIEDATSELDVIFNYYLVLDSYKDKVPDNLKGKKRVVLSYFLNKPWEMPIFKGI